MNSVHDMGGMHGFGPIVIDESKSVFHENWHGRIFALRMACAFHRKWNADMGRYARERMPPADFLAASYYERGLYSLETLLVENGLISSEELKTGRATSVSKNAPTLQVADIPKIVRSRRRTRIQEDVPPSYKVGDFVMAKNINPIGHTRMPRYVRGRRGVIDRDHGVFVFADSNAMTREKKPQHLYSVRFTASELWGDNFSLIDSIYLDLWDDHLEPA